MLTTSELCTSFLDMMVSCYNSTLSPLLDKYAPLRTKYVANRNVRMPWFNHKIKDAIKAKWRAKSKWRYIKSAQDLSVFKKKKIHAIYLMIEPKFAVIITPIRSSKTVKIKESSSMLESPCCMTPTLYRFLVLTLFSFPMILEISLHIRLRI